MLGIYQNDSLVKTYTSFEQTSEILPTLLQEVLELYSFSKFIYANGPGSYMGIKISYISLKTISIVKNIPLFSLSAFELNDYKPILANKNICFVYKDNKITLEKQEPGEFFMPHSLKGLKISTDSEPFYFLDAI